MQTLLRDLRSPAGAAGESRLIFHGRQTSVNNRTFILSFIIKAKLSFPVPWTICDLVRCLSFALHGRLPVNVYFLTTEYGFSRDSSRTSV